MNYRFDWSVLWSNADALLAGTIATIEVFIPAVVLSIVAGVLIGTAKSSSWELLRDLAQYYIHLFRNVPGIVIIFFFYFVYKLDPYSAAVLGVAMHHSAYIAEVTQAGIRSAARQLAQDRPRLGFHRR